MFRKLVLRSLLSVGIFGAVAANTPALSAAIPAHHRYDHGDRFRVIYNDRGCWDVFGRYANRHDAERAAQHFRERHFTVRIDEMRF